RTAALAQYAKEIYEGIRDRIAGAASLHPVRFWNFVPDITGSCEDALFRYMRFNDGRYSAMHPWMLRRGHSVPATAVGNPSGDDLVVHCLAQAEGGVPLENPRQTPAFEYSPRYVPRPPVFARAIWLRER